MSFRSVAQQRTPKHRSVPFSGRRAIHNALVPVLTAMAALLILAPPAMGITETDSRFLREWYADGLFAASDQAAIDAAHAIVSYLDDRPTQDGVSHLADVIVHATDGQVGHHHYSYFEAGAQIYLAVYYYAPRHLPLLDAYADPTPAPRTAPPNNAQLMAA